MTADAGQGPLLCGGCGQPVPAWNAHLPRDTQNGVGWECRPPAGTTARSPEPRPGDRFACVVCRRHGNLDEDFPPPCSNGAARHVVVPLAGPGA